MASSLSLIRSMQSSVVIAMVVACSLVRSLSQSHPCRLFIVTYKVLDEINLICNVIHSKGFWTHKMNDYDKTLLNLNSKPKPNNLVLQPERAAAVVG